MGFTTLATKRQALERNWLGRFPPAAAQGYQWPQVLWTQTLRGQGQGGIRTGVESKAACSLALNGGFKGRQTGVSSYSKVQHYLLSALFLQFTFFSLDGICKLKKPLNLPSCWSGQNALPYFTKTSEFKKPKCNPLCNPLLHTTAVFLTLSPHTVLGL